jgi:hypothetical protein
VTDAARRDAIPANLVTHEIHDVPEPIARRKRSAGMVAAYSRVPDSSVTRTVVPASVWVPNEPPALDARNTSIRSSPIALPVAPRTEMSHSCA